jgi:hypothetical protein
MTTTEFDMNEQIKDAIYEAGIEATVQDYTEAGMLTNDTGIVIKMKDGSEFQVTIKQSR